MRIDELDEFQGLTPHMVRQHLEKTGWHLKSWDHSREWHLEHCEGPPCVAIYDGSKDGMYQFDLESALRALLVVAKRSPQSLLREINPRMRKGMPSEAAREAHPGGLWLATPDFACIGAHVPVVVTFDGDGFGVWHPEGFALPDSKPKTAALWHFWPCDANGNKVRWPTDEEGNIL